MTTEAPAAQQSAAPMLRAGTLPPTLVIDGILNEAWAAADATDAFAQADPIEGALPTGRTVVRVIASPDALAIGIICEDANPSGIVSFSVRRDAPVPRASSPVVFVRLSYALLMG